MTSRKDTTILLSLAVIISLAVGLFGAFVASRLWFWFFVPFGLPIIGAFHMAGIFGFISLVKGVSRKDLDNDSAAKRIEFALIVALAYAMTWFLGSIYALLMVYSA